MAPSKTNECTALLMSASSALSDSSRKHAKNDGLPWSPHREASHTANLFFYKKKRKWELEIKILKMKKENGNWKMEKHAVVLPPGLTLDRPFDRLSGHPSARAIVRPSIRSSVDQARPHPTSASTPPYFLSRPPCWTPPRFSCVMRFRFLFLFVHCFICIRIILI